MSFRVVRVSLLSMALLAAVATGTAQDSGTKPIVDNVPLKTYTDPAHGVSFRYPVAWQQVKKFDQYCQPVVFNNKLKPTIIVQFTGAGNYYQKTYLDSLYFQYGGVRMASAATCRKLADEAADGETGTPANTTINGVGFRHSRGGACGLSHGIDADVYTTFRDGVCLVFEADFTTCSGIDDTRDLTRAEIKALQKHLDAIMFSVTFEAVPAKSSR
jgi:hypothetical protein